LPEAQPVAVVLPATAAAAGAYRWRICALLFFATTINYIDRQVLGVLAPELQRAIGWNEIQYSNIVNAFQGAYAIGLLLAGGFIDRVGTRVGYAAATGLWSIATVGHALVRTVAGFGIARFFLGLGEAGNFPAAVKTVAEWFPKKERAFATGIFNSGANIGATLAPLIVPWLTVRYGWQAAFIATGALSALWILPWLAVYRAPPRTGISEPAGKVPWARLLKYRQAWAILLGKFITDPTWWFLMFWLPKFLNERHGLTLTELGWPLVIIYNMATLGSVAGGWISARLFQLGWSVNRARKTAMLICALSVLPIVFAGTVADLRIAVALIALAAAAHQGWSANLLTLASDLFPQHAVASVTGIGGFGGAIGGMIISTFTGFVLQFAHSYVPIFIVAGSVYLIALLTIHILTPALRPVNLGTGI
jgi:ACS family hexuronate transporter-like MFS transporter